MGGNALKNIINERINKEKYLEIEKDVIKMIEILREKKLINNYHVPRYLNDKETFGDLDIIYTSNDNIKEKVITKLKSSEYIINGHILSCEYKKFQVDFIKIEEKHFESAKCFFDFSSFGEILGRMFKFNEIKYGHLGLYINIYENHEVSREVCKICLSINPEEIFNYLKLDYKKIKNGFVNKKEMFDLLINCKFFCPNLFLENLNKNHKTKVKKRPVYKEFLDYLILLNLPINKEMENLENNKLLKHEIMINTLKHFNKIEEYNDQMMKYMKRLNSKKKFNGKIVNKITKKEGKELGILMNNFRNSFESTEDFYDFILNNDENEIEKKILNFM